MYIITALDARKPHIWKDKFGWWRVSCTCLCTLDSKIAAQMFAFKLNQKLLERTK